MIFQNNYLYAIALHIVRFEIVIFNIIVVFVACEMILFCFSHFTPSIVPVFHWQPVFTWNRIVIILFRWACCSHQIKGQRTCCERCNIPFRLKTMDWNGCCVIVHSIVFFYHFCARFGWCIRKKNSNRKYVIEISIS